MRSAKYKTLPGSGQNASAPRSQAQTDTNGNELNRSARAWQNGRRLAVFFLLVGAGVCFGQATNETKRIDYSDFRIVTERNIFNPRRYARSGPRPAQPSARVDAFTLVGTMTYEKGPFAFFEGTSSEYRKVLKPTEIIAGYKVTNIAFNSVKLADQTNEIQLAVGMQMRREENGPWQVSSATQPLPQSSAELATAGPSRSGDSSAAAAAVSQPAAGADTEGTASNAAGAADDVLRRLMQRREQEMNR